MTIWEIDERILSMVDPETGEILDETEFDALQMERTQKIENVALWVKNLAAEAAAIKSEEEALRERRKATERRSEALRRYLSNALCGEKFSTAKCAVSFRKSSKCIPDDGFVEWAKNNGRDDLLKYSDPEIRVSDVKNALKRGEKLPAQIVESINISIK